jgi:hypothetical protein
MSVTCAALISVCGEWPGERVNAQPGRDENKNPRSEKRQAFSHEQSLPPLKTLIALPKLDHVMSSD